MEHIDPICSLESRLHLVSVYSVGILNTVRGPIKRVLFKDLLAENEKWLFIKKGNLFSLRDTLPETQNRVCPLIGPRTVYKKLCQENLFFKNRKILSPSLTQNQIACARSLRHSLLWILQRLVKLEYITKNVGEWNTSPWFMSEGLISIGGANLTDCHLLIVHTSKRSDLIRVIISWWL